MPHSFRHSLVVLGLSLGLGLGLAGCNVYQPEAKPAEAKDATTAAADPAAADPAAAETATAPVEAGAEAGADAAAATASGRIADPFRRADASFSRFALNSSAVRPQSIGRLVNGDICDDDMIECSWADANGVAHTFGGKVLAIKSIKLAPGDRRAIGALDIGTARQPPEVLKRVRAFLPEIAIKCVKAADAGEGGRSACQGSFRNGGWLKLLFSGETGELVEARIDAFQIN